MYKGQATDIAFASDQHAAQMGSVVHALQLAMFSITYPKYNQQVTPQVDAKVVADMDKVVLQNVLVCNASIVHVDLRHTCIQANTESYHIK